MNYRVKQPHAHGAALGAARGWEGAAPQLAGWAGARPFPSFYPIPSEAMIASLSFYRRKGVLRWLSAPDGGSPRWLSAPDGRVPRWLSAPWAAERGFKVGRCEALPLILGLPSEAMIAVAEFL